MLGIHYIFIDHEGGALGVVRNALSNLAIAYISLFRQSTQVVAVDGVPDRAKFAEEVEQILRSYVVASQSKLVSRVVSFRWLVFIVPQVLHEQSSRVAWSATSSIASVLAVEEKNPNMTSETRVPRGDGD